MVFFVFSSSAVHRWIIVIHNTHLKLINTHNIKIYIYVYYDLVYIGTVQGFFISHAESRACNCSSISIFINLGGVISVTWRGFKKYVFTCARVGGYARNGVYSVIVSLMTFILFN